MTAAPHPVAASDALERSRGARMVGPATLAAAVVASLAYTRAVDPHAGGFYPLCPIHAVSGLYCPGCGTIRALHALVHGDLPMAFGHNVLVPPLLVALVVGIVVWGRSRWRGTPLRLDPPTWLPLTAGALVLVFGLLRNVPGLEWLAP